MIIERKIVHLTENERIDSLELKEKGELLFYSYDYEVKKNGDWKIYIRWDNFQKQPHIDRYDESGNHVESVEGREKTLKEVLELVDIFGKNLVSMDLSRL